MDAAIISALVRSLSSNTGSVRLTDWEDNKALSKILPKSCNSNGCDMARRFICSVRAQHIAAQLCLDMEAAACAASPMTKASSAAGHSHDELMAKHVCLMPWMFCNAVRASKATQARVKKGAASERGLGRLEVFKPGNPNSLSEQQRQDQLAAAHVAMGSMQLSCSAAAVGVNAGGVLLDAVEAAIDAAVPPLVLASSNAEVTANGDQSV